MASVPELLDIGDIARLTKLGRRTIYRLVAEGKFPKQRHVGRRSLWKADDVAAWVDSLPEAS